MGLREPVVNIGAEGMERHTALQIPLGPRDLSPGQPARAPNLDALGAQAKGRRDAALHGPAERDTLLQLHGDVFGDQLRIQLRLLDLLDRDVDLTVDHLLQVYITIKEIKKPELDAQLVTENIAVQQIGRAHV